MSAANTEAAWEHANFVPCDLVETMHLNLSWTTMMIPINFRGIHFRGVTAMSTEALLALFGGQFYHVCSRQLYDQTQPRDLLQCVRHIESAIIRELARLCTTRRLKLGGQILGDHALSLGPEPHLGVPGLVELSVTKRVSDEHLSHHDCFANEKRWLERLSHTGLVAAPLAFDNTRRVIVTAYAGAPLQPTNAPDDLAAQLERILAVLAAHNCRHNNIIPEHLLVLDGVVRLINFSWAHELDRPIPAASWHGAQVPDLGKPSLGLRCGSMFDDRCAVENVINRIAPVWRPDSAETHLVVDWAKYYTEDFLEIACRRVGLEIIRVVAMSSIPDATRYATMSAFLRNASLEASDPRGAVPFTIYILRDVNPAYEVRPMTKGGRRVNAKVFDLKHQLQNTGGVAQLMLHSTESIQETKDSLAALGLLEQYAEKRFDDMTAALRALDTVPGFRYVLLRHSENVDVDLLVSDYFKAKTALDGSSADKPGERYDDGGHGVVNLVIIADSRVAFALHTAGDGYFDERWQGDVLAERVFNPSTASFLPSETHLAPLLLYDILVRQKRHADVPKEDAADWLRRQNGLDFASFDDAWAALDAFMVRHDYRYVHNAQDVSIRRMTLSLESEADKERVDGSVLPCDFSGSVIIRVSWRVFYIPKTDVRTFGTSHVELNATLLDFAYNLCNSHETEHALDAFTCASEVKDAALAVIARQCDVNASCKGLLLCGLAGGVTNQEIMVENCVELAVLLNRALVTPRPKVVARDTFAHLDDDDADFSRLWDFGAFEKYTRMRGVRLVDAASLSEAESRPTLRADLQRYHGGSERLWKFTRLLANGSVVETVSAEPPKTMLATKDLLLSQLYDAGPVVLAAEPFQTIVHQLPSGHYCCSAAESIIARADDIRESLPASYDHNAQDVLIRRMTLSLESEADKERVDGSVLPCDFSGSVIIRVSWRVFYIPKTDVRTFGTSHVELNATLLDFAYNLCNSHETEHALDAFTCASEVKDAALAVIARQCDVNASCKGLLLCGLAGGVTNQEIMVENCVELAVLLNRALVTPRPKVVARDTFAHLDDDDADFSRLWDFGAFEKYTRMRGVRLVDAASLSEAESRPTLRADLQRYHGGSERLWKFTRLLANGSVVETVSAEPPKTMLATKDLLLSQLYDAGPVVLAAEPFQTIVHQLPSGHYCCSAAESIIARADDIRESLPASYDCLHARIEEDWYDHSVVQLVEALSRADPPVPEGRTLYIATGASEGLLAPLASRFDIRMRPPHDKQEERGAFMSYAGALVDRLVCAHAERFFGNCVSTFSLRIYQLRQKRETFWTQILLSRSPNDHGCLLK